jgi:hypothetical protein
VPAANPEWNCWANDSHTQALYRRRCRQEVEEMTCAAQAAEVFGKLVSPGETLLDAGCGAAYYWHSFRARQVPIEYHGLDYTPQMVDLAHGELCPATGLPRSRVSLAAIEDLSEAAFDNVLCFNVLTNSPHYALPLWRLLSSARKRILIRESMGPSLIVRYTTDPYLDEGKRHIRVYHNCYPIEEVVAFMQNEGFKVTRIRDRRTDDGVESVVDIPHTWRILLGERT